MLSYTKCNTLMNIRPITEWTLYRRRFAVAYSVLALFVAGLLLLYSNAIPAGLGPSEQQSVIVSSGVTFDKLPSEVIDLPYHALQKLSVQWLGVSPFGVRLPSIIFGMITALCVTLLLRRWFPKNVALIASIILVTSSWFLGLARLGSPAIMIPLWTSILILTATYVSQQTKNWKWWRVAFCMAAAVSIYTPYMAYLFLAAALASLAQPHLRYLLRESNRINLFIGGFFFVLLLVPLGWGIYSKPALARDLLAVPASLPDPIQFLRDFAKAASTLINPFNLTTTEIVTPLLGVVSVSLLLIGGARLLRDFHSVRAHVLLIWAALLLPVIGLNPGNLSVMMIPSILVITIGLNQIIRYWYRLFPLNPYARIFAILPLGVLLLSIVQFSYQRYTYGMLYSPQAGVTFRMDAFLAQREIDKIPAEKNITIVVPDVDTALYSAMAVRHKGAAVVTGKDASERPGEWIVAADQIAPLTKTFKAIPSKILVSDRKSDSQRFVVYQR